MTPLAKRTVAFIDEANFCLKITFTKALGHGDDEVLHLIFYNFCSS